jgi:hypothetical protein
MFSSKGIDYPSFLDGSRPVRRASWSGSRTLLSEEAADSGFTIATHLLSKTHGISLLCLNAIH